MCLQRSNLIVLFSIALVSICSAGNVDSIPPIIQKQIDSLYAITDTFYYSGEYNKSLETREKLTSLLLESKQWDLGVEQLNYSYYTAIENLKNIVEAEAFLDSAVFYAEKYLGENDINFFYTLANKGYDQWVQTNYRHAITYYDKAINGFENLNEAEDYYFHNVRKLLDCYKKIGESKLAQRFSKNYHNILVEKGQRYSYYGIEMLQLLALNYRENSEYQKAIQVLKNALEDNTQVKDKYSRLKKEYDIYQTMGKTFYQAGSLDSALHYLKLCNQKSFKHTGKIRHFHHEDIAKVYLESNEFSLAIQEFKYALQKYKKRSIEVDKVKARRNSFLAESFRLQSQLDSAAVYNSKAIKFLGIAPEVNFSSYNDYASLANFNIESVQILSRVAQFNLDKFQESNKLEYRDLALKRFQQAMDGSKYLQKELLSKASKYQLNKNLQSHFSEYLDLLIDLYTEEKSVEYFEKILSLIEDNKAVVLKEDIYKKTLIEQTNIPNETIEKEIAFRERINGIKRKIYNHKFENKDEVNLKKEWEDDLVKQIKSYSEFQQKLESKYPDYFDNKYKVQQVDYKTIQKSLDKNEVYLNYFKSNNNFICLWMGQSDHGIKFIGNHSSINNDVLQLLQIIRTNPLKAFNQDDIKMFSTSAHLLYNKLIPQDALNNGEENAFIISGHSSLYYLPFEILLTYDNSQARSFKNLDYLFKDFVIEYAYSAELWSSARNRKIKSKDLSVISFAPFIKSGISDTRACNNETNLGSLSCSIEEVDHISKTLSNKIYKDNEAVRNAFVESTDCGIIHLATHACLDDEQPEFNKLMFYDDYLAIQDLESMKLKAQLAVLSACNTGVGKIRTGEGMINLGNGFRNAGVSSLITSLWSINDCSTSEILSSFYSELPNMSISESLNNAKIEYLNSADKISAHPYYWASLVFSGDTNVFTGKSGDFFSISKLLFLFAVCLVLFFFVRRKK